MTTKALFAMLLCLWALAGCEQLGIPDPAKEAAAAADEGKAVGAACRHSGRALEDCYALNPGAPKAAVFDGWRSMNDYMVENKLEIVPPTLPPTTMALPSRKPQAENHAEAEKTADEAHPVVKENRIETRHSTLRTRRHAGH